MLKMLVVWRSKQQRKKTIRGQNLHENKSVQNSSKSMQNYHWKTEIMKSNLDVDNICGLGFKKTKKEGELGAEFASKLVCQELYQIQRKV